MTIEEIKKILGITTLDEAQQTLLTEKLEMMIDVKAKEKSDSIIAEEKERLVEEYETKFEEYKKDITSKFSSFVDSVLDEELEIPEKVMEFAKKGELYNDLIEDFKKRLAIDAGVLTDDVKSLLKEAKDEILSLKDEVNGLLSKNMEVEEDAKEMAAQLYIQKKCEGLSEAKRIRVMGLLGDLRDKKEIDKKFDFIVENVIKEEVAPGTEVPAGEDASNVNICPKCGTQMTATGENGTMVCPKCGAKMEDAEASIVPASDGTGKAVVETVVEPAVVTVSEEENPFQSMKKGWAKMIRENKI
jgi:ribosomal protein L37AE/L43A